MQICRLFCILTFCSKIIFCSKITFCSNMSVMVIPIYYHGNTHLLFHNIFILIVVWRQVKRCQSTNMRRGPVVFPDHKLFCILTFCSKIIFCSKITFCSNMSVMVIPIYYHGNTHYEPPDYVLRMLSKETKKQRFTLPHESHKALHVNFRRLTRLPRATSFNAKESEAHRTWWNFLC